MCIRDSIGGGINTDSFSSLVCCNFIDNSATFGGGLSVTDFQGSVTINYSSFLNNTAQNSGGGVRLTTSGNNALVYVTGSAFINNTASFGGGVYYASSGQYASMKVTETVFRNNTATTSQESSRNTIYGGGVSMFGDSSYISVDTSDFSMNSASGS